MAKYIDADTLIKRVKDLPTWWADGGGYYGGAMKYPEGMFEPEDVISIIEDIPAADVAPVHRGRWKFGKDLPDSFGGIIKNKYHLYCSECLEQAFNRSEDNDPDFDIDTPYCPNCGALMDKEE